MLRAKRTESLFFQKKLKPIFKTYWTNPFPFRLASRGILSRPALRDAPLPSGEAARQWFRLAQKILKVSYGGPGENRTPDPAMRMPYNTTLRRAHCRVGSPI